MTGQSFGVLQKKNLKKTNTLTLLQYVKSNNKNEEGKSNKPACKKNHRCPQKRQLQKDRAAFFLSQSF